MITGITFGVLVERIKRYLTNGWPDIADNYTSNEIMLYVYEALATAITNASKGDYQATGIYSSPEGFTTTFEYPCSGLTRDNNTGWFKLTLPAPPVNLPLGFSISAPTFIGNLSESYPIIWLESYNRSVSTKMPTPNFGIFAWPENRILYFDTNGQNIINSGLTVRVSMRTARSQNGVDTDLINAPDDAIDFVFNEVINKITGRVDRPKELVNAGNSIPTAR